LQQEGAFNILSTKRTRALILLSRNLGETFGFRASPADPPADPSQLTAGDLCQWVLERLAAGPSMPSPTDPGKFHAVAAALAQLTETPPKQIRPWSELCSVIPRQKRRQIWQKICNELDVRLPPLVYPRWLQIAIGLGALAITFGTTIPAVIALDHSQKGSEPPAWLARIIVRGGFLIIFFAIALLLRVLLRPLASEVPDAIRTVGRLTAIAAQNPRITSQPWTPEEVWEHVQAIVAESLALQPQQVSPQTPLSRGGRAVQSPNAIIPP
jgi:hypothetical protein